MNDNNSNSNSDDNKLIKATQSTTKPIEYPTYQPYIYTHILSYITILIIHPIVFLTTLSVIILTLSDLT